MAVFSTPDSKLVPPKIQNFTITKKKLSFYNLHLISTP